MTILDTAEGNRIEAIGFGAGWRRWGPYLSERQWGTVREDYSPGGTAWEYFPHDHARSRTYRWGEDGIGGFSDDRQHWCLSVGLWNGRDPILKERLFGLTNSQGNHGEDVKELYYYLDSVPTHSYNRMLYRYPQAEYPYQKLIDANAARGQDVPEYELLDTGVFDGDRYFDVTIEYCKASPDDILMRVTAVNRGPDPAPLVLVPQLWARNTWAWRAGSRRPLLRAAGRAVQAIHPRLGEMRLFCDADVAPAFCENETNVRRLYGMDGKGPFKDGLHELIVEGREAAVRRDQGTKLGYPVAVTIPPGGSHQVRLRFRPAEREGDPFEWFDARFQARMDEADEFYAAVQANVTDPDERLIQRQALAGMLWSKQLYLLDVRRWLDGDPAQPTPPASRTRNADWRHLNNADVISMPDTWEYPWYAAWDLAFHCTTFALIDPGFAKDQLILLLREWYMHPNGQIPAYEWAFGDVNPPVHAWACVAGLQDGPHAEGQGATRRLPRTYVPEADAELHLVGEPQGFRRASNIFQRRLPGPGQYRPVRPLGQPLPTGGTFGTGRRHGVDGDVHAEPAADRAGAGVAEQGVRGHRKQVLRALPVHRRGHGGAGSGRHHAARRGAVERA